jgi:hypothetical protein
LSKEYLPVWLWETSSGQKVLEFKAADNEALVLALSPQCDRLAVGQKDGTVQFHKLTPQGWKGEQARAPRPEDCEQHWAALAGADAAAAYNAIWLLAGGRDTTVDFLKERLSPVKPAGGQVRPLIADLDSDQFDVREKAHQKLRQLGGIERPRKC